MLIQADQILKVIVISNTTEKGGSYIRFRIKFKNRSIYDIIKWKIYTIEF